MNDTPNEASAPILVRTSGGPSQKICTSEAAKHPYVRAVGNGKEAWLETAPPYCRSEKERQELEGSWVPQRFPGTVTVTDEGRVTIESEAMDAPSRDALALDFYRALRDVGVIKLEQGKRYLTKCYVALDRVEAERHAELDHTDPVSIKVADASLVHVASSWALWDDGVLTGTIGLPAWTQRIKSLTKYAERLISDVQASDSGSPACGFKLLTSIDAIEGEETLVQEGPKTGGYAGIQVKRLALRLKDGSHTTLYSYTEGYFEGYAYELATTLEGLPVNATALSAGLACPTLCPKR